MNSLTQPEIIKIEQEIEILQDCLRILEETQEKYDELDKYVEINPFTKEYLNPRSINVYLAIFDRRFQVSHAMYDRQKLLEGTESLYKAVKVAKYCKGDDPEWDAKWEHMMSFYSDGIEEWETPDFLTSKVTGEVFCTLEGYARLSRLPIEAVFKRVYVIGGRKRFNMQEIDLGDEEVNIIPLTEVAKWIVDDNPCVARLLIGDDYIILPANFVSQLRNQKALDTESQAKSIPPTKSIPVKSNPVSDNKSVEGTVYLIGNRENNTLKIGFSNGNVRTRLAAFQVSCAHRLEILKTKKGTLKQEKELLERFKKFNIRNEWFAWDDSIIENF